MKRLLLLALAATFAACSPDIPTSPDVSGNFVVAEFDPAHNVIPLPNDLVFLDAQGNVQPTLQAPTTGGTDAQNEFNRDYLNHLDGFPLESTASMTFDKPIDPTSVTLFPAAGATLAVFDVKNNLPVTNLTVTVADAPNGGQTLNFIPTSGYWERGGQYAVIVLGGENGIKGQSSGQTVHGSPTFALLTSSTPLITCDASGNNCTLNTSAIPTTEKDPAAQHAQQVMLAKQLETLRINYKPILDGAQAAVPGLKRTDIALVWTFTITSQAEVTFDPAHSIIPFPNDILFVDQTNGTTDGGLHIPVPPDAGALTQLYMGLNTLDGFSATAPIVSENGEGTGPLIGRDSAGAPARVDAASVALGVTGTMNLVSAGAGKGALPTTADGSIIAHACLNCPGIVMTQPDGGPILLADGGPKPDTLAIVPDVPLTERSQYAAYITTDLKDTTGKKVIASPVFALVRSSAPLFDGTHSTVSLLTDAQAQQLEPLRSGLKVLFDNLALNGLPRTKVALAWGFTTQSTMSTLSQLHAAPTAGGVPTSPTYVSGAYSANIKTALGVKGIPTNNMGTIYLGSMVDLFALTSPVGTFNPGLAGATPQVIPFVMVTPPSCPMTGCPVTIFGHGLFGDRTNAYAIANALAGAGEVTIAIDEPWHGERNTCTGFGAYLTQATGAPAGTFTDSSACVAGGTCTSGRCTKAGGQACVPNDPGANGDALCQALSQGNCTAGGTCEGSTFATSAAGGAVPVSGWKILNLANFFASRDNFRQQVISHAQLARVLAATGASSLAGRSVAFDASQISYAGQSLGSLLGSLYTSVAPEIGNTALNVGGADWELLLLTSPTFAPLRAGFIAGLAQEGVAPNSPEFDTFLGIAKWIIDPADPANAAYYLTHPAGLPAPLPPNIDPTKRRLLVQWILDDQVVVNPSTVELVNAATGSIVSDPTRISTPPFWSYQFNGATNLGPGISLSDIPTCDRHGFLLQPSDGACTSPAGAPTPAGLALTGAGQTQLVTFISGAAPPFP
jgi:hypothetical protein